MRRILFAILILATCAASAQLPPPLPSPDLKLVHGGAVTAMVTQPDGGIVIAGRFRRVDGVVRDRLARLQPDGTVDAAWVPSTDSSLPTNGEVLALAGAADGSVYVGGTFTFLYGLERDGLAKLTPSGVPDKNWVPPGWYLNASVMAVVDGTDVVVAGPHHIGAPAPILTRLSGTGDPVQVLWQTEIASAANAISAASDGFLYLSRIVDSETGAQHTELTRLSIATGQPDPSWSATLPGWVVAQAVSPQGWFYVSSCQDVAGSSVCQLQRFSFAGGGLVDPHWLPQPDGRVSRLTVTQDGALFALGMFENMGAYARRSIARFLPDGTLDPGWNQGGGAGLPADHVYSLAALSGGRVVLGGFFDSVQGQSRLGLTWIDGIGVLGPPRDVAFPGKVNAVARQPDGSLIVAGSFAKADQFARANLLRLLPDGRVDPQWQSPADAEVNQVTVGQDGSVFIAGGFSMVNGVHRRRMAKLVAEGQGEVDPHWNPSPDRQVYALQVGPDGWVYAGGYFGTIGFMPQSYLARLSPEGAGAPDPDWAPQISTVFSFAFDGHGGLVAGGPFQEVNGQSRPHLARLDLAAGAALDPLWNPAPDGRVDSIAVDGDHVYLSGSFYSIGGHPMYGSGRVSRLGHGAADVTWPALYPVSRLYPDGEGSVFAVAHWQPDKPDLIKLSAADGEADPDWSPRFNGDVRSVLIIPGHRILVAGEFTDAGGEERIGLAAFALDAMHIFSRDFEVEQTQ